MKATGIVRRVDDLGRIVIPREIRHRLDIHDGDPLELYLEDDCIVFKRYNPLYDSCGVIERAIDYIRECDDLSTEKKSDAVKKMKEAIEVLLKKEDV